MSVKYKYTVTGYSRHAYEKCEGNLSQITGYDTEVGSDTLSEAKSKARYAISEEARISNEASERSVYAQVCDANGEVRWDILDLSQYLKSTSHSAPPLRQTQVQRPPPITSHRINMSITQTEMDIHINEAGEIMRMVESLTRDIDNGKEPDVEAHPILRHEFGRRMTLKRTRERLSHVRRRLNELIQSMDKLSKPTT